MYYGYDQSPLTKLLQALTGNLVLILIIMLVIRILEAMMMRFVAHEKGYDDSIHVFAATFWLGIFGCLYTIALPDKRIYSQLAEQHADIMKGINASGGSVDGTFTQTQTQGTVASDNGQKLKKASSIEELAAQGFRIGKNTTSYNEEAQGKSGRICPKCWSVVDENMAFCRHCGNKL